MPKLLTTEQMAEFASSGCLFFDELIDEQTNKEFLDDIGHTDIDKADITLVLIFALSRASLKAIPFITVANIPI